MPFVREVDLWVSGPPLLLHPASLLIRWPKGQPPPKVGAWLDRDVRLLKTSSRELARALVLGALLADGSPRHDCELVRAEAAHALGIENAAKVYSESHAVNLIKIGARLCAPLRAQIHGGCPAKCRDLIRVIAFDAPEAEQIARWNAQVASRGQDRGKGDSITVMNSPVSSVMENEARPE